MNMTNLYRSLGKQDTHQGPIQTSPTFEYEYPPESKQLDFTLRDISQLQDTEPFTIPTYNTQGGASCESRFNQGVSSPGNNGDNTFRKEKRAKSKDMALYLPYSGSRGKASVEVTQSSERSSHFASQSLEQRDSRVSANKDSFHRPKSMMDTKRKEYGQEASGNKAIKIIDGRASIGNSSRGKNEVLGSMKGEFEDLKKHLAKKERELADTMNLANHLQQMINKGRDGGPIDTSFIQQLQAKQRELEKENEELRDTVRSEMMVSERNRSQLEIVQNMMERRLESMGLVSPSPESGLRGVDLLIEYQNLQVKVHQKQEEIDYLYKERDGLVERVQFLEIENEKLEAAFNETRQENEKIALDLENGLKALENSREIQKKLEEERGEVIDYYTSQLSSQEEQEKKVLQVEEEMREILAENESLKDQMNEFAKSYDNLRQELEEKMEMVAKLNEEKVELFEVHQSLEDEKEEALVELEKTREEKEILEIEINNLKGRLMNAEKDYENLQENQVELEKRLKKELDKLREENRYLEQEKREGVSQKELYEVKLLDEMQKYERKLTEQRKLYEHQAMNNKEIYENEIQDVKEEYEKQLKQEQDFFQSKLQSLTTEYDLKVQEGSKMFDTKLNELLETKGQLETRTLDIESQSEELTKLNNEIRELKQKIRDIEAEKDDRITEITREFGHTVKNLEDLLTSKNNELNGVSLANGRLKAELNQINENFQATRNDLNKTLRELDDRKRDLENQRLLSENLDGELNDMKAANGFLTKHYNKQEREIDEYENKVSNTMNSLKFAERTLFNIESDNHLLTTENDELKEDLRSVKNENNRLRAELKGMEDTHRDGQKRIEELESELDTVRKETDFVKKETVGLGENLKGLKNVEEGVKDLIEELLDMMRAFIQDMNRNSATAQNFLASCSGQMKELISLSYVKLEEEMRDADLRKQCEYLQEWFIMLLKEVEKDVLRILKLKEEVITLKRESTSGSSYIKTDSSLDNKNYTLDSSNRLKVIREEKQELQERVFALQEREETHEREKMQLKRENIELNNLINELRDSNHQLRGTIDQISKESTGSKSVLDSEVSAARILKGHYEVLLKEKKQLEDFFTIVIKSIPSQDHGHLVRNILELHLEICKLERDNISVETNLMDKESELKVSLKIGNKSASEIVQRRKEVEKLRLELQNIQTQLGILIKRKNFFLEDLKNCEKVEKRRFDHSLDLEKELIQAREEHNELKLKCDDLVAINGALQNKYRELNENNLMQHTSGNSLKPSPLITMNDESQFIKAGAGQKQLDRSYSRRPSMGGHSEAGSTISGKSGQKHRLLNKSPLREMNQQMNEDAHSQSLIIGKGGNVASLRDKLSETKNLLKNLRGNKENM